MDVISLDDSSEEDSDLPCYSQRESAGVISAVGNRQGEPDSDSLMSAADARQRLVKQGSNMDVNEKEMRKAQQKAKREEEKTIKRKEKELEKAVRQAEKDARVEARAGERQKQMIVLLDQEMSENSDFMHVFAQRMGEYGIKYRITPHPTPATFRWKRVNSQRSIDESSSKMVIGVQETDEKYVLICLKAVDFARLVDEDKAERMGSQDQSSLSTFMSHLKQTYDRHEITLAVCGLEAYHRNVKTAKNRQFRETVRSQGVSSSQKQSSTLPVVSKEDVLEAVVKLQLYFTCVVRFVDQISELPDILVNYTRAIADVPYKKEAVFSFHAEPSGISRKVSSKDAGKEASLIWQHMLMQFNNVSNHIASAIVEEYSKPSALYQAYAKCVGLKEAELLLQDIVVRRGVGVTSTSRRVGPTLSRKIHTFLTCSKGDHVLQ